MSEETIQALTALRDSLLADVPLARTREEHIRVSARAHAAERILAIATRPASDPTPDLSDGHNPPPTVI